MTINVTERIIELNDNPKPAQLCQLWQTLKSDATVKGMFMDTMPVHLETFLSPMLTDEMYLWTIEVDGQLAGAHWIHDVMPYNGARSGWVASYYFRHMRGLLHTEPLRQTYAAARAIGISHILGGTRPSNRVAYQFALNSGLHDVGYIEAFGWFEGKLDDLIIFALDPQDANEAMRQGHQRASYYRSLKPAA